MAAIAFIGLGACSDAPNPENAQAAGGAEDLSELSATLASLEERKSLLEDANDIKRLQRAYGYYVDKALWDDVANLFAANGTIEIGLDGVYVGRSRVREYLYALGDGKTGLAEGQLNEHLQLMPVITVAPDGMTAKGRWRAVIMVGQLGESAIWGEGPYENEYVKEDGVWKFAKVHWYQSVVVPYEGGWQVNDDVNGGKWVSDRLPSDQPPSVPYETWPATFLPPFHFPNPVLGAVAPIAVADLGATGNPQSREELAQNAATLAREIGLLNDENEIANLQRTYGFYTDKGFWTQASDLFSADGTIEVGGRGVFVGKPRILQYLRSQGPEFPQQGRLFEQMQLQPIIHVAPDGRSAKARWHMFAQEAVSGEYANWGLGLYENEYVKENGAWKIRSLHLYNTMYTPYEEGWGKAALPNPGPLADLAPDRPASVEYAAYPTVFVPPFHYPNPASGEPVYDAPSANGAGVAAASVAQIEVSLASLDRDLTRLEDFNALERLNSIYGYYLARNRWDDFAGMFSRDGTIEIAMRGVYVGPASVRRSMDLYGEAGQHHGLLHNHMQYQPVIHIAADGRTAKMRSRAFSVMGQHGAYSMWMGGTYENEFVKEDGIWKISKDQVFNTYFAPYAVGWKDLAPRPPPQVSETNPPDLPPTHPFEMYPGAAFLPPFHYPNPATGNSVTWP
jgi:hypothetical protein